MAQAFQVTGRISQVERSSCFLSSHLCAQSCSQFLVSLHSDPQGHFPSRAPRMQGIGAPILANISKEELLGRLSPAQRKEGKFGHPDLGKHRNQASSGFWGTELMHLFTSVPSSNSQGATAMGFSGLIWFVLFLNILCSYLKRMNKE